MSALKSLIDGFRYKLRRQRAELFARSFAITPETKILDIGSEDGRHIHFALEGTNATPSNVTIADIRLDALHRGHERYGFQPVLVPQSGRLPFRDGAFDVVFCSSVIEHVTIPKDEVWSTYSTREFKRRAMVRQKEFAAEIRRVGKGYYVQTPYKHFPLEVHTWLPFFGYLPRWILLPFLAVFNRVWLTHTWPDWHLLGNKEMAALFPQATIVREKALGLTKSLTALKKGA